MANDLIEPQNNVRALRRFRYLIDIIVLLAVTFLLDAVLGAFVQVPIDLEKGFVLDAVVKVLLVGVGCGLVLLRGEKLADIGLKRPESWTHIDHWRWPGRNCFRRHVSFGKGGVSPRPQQVQGCAWESGTRVRSRFV